MRNQKDNQDIIIKALFNRILGLTYFVSSVILFIILNLILPNFIQDRLWGFITLLSILLIIILIAVILAKSYCRYCDRNVFPIMNDHCCISMFKDMKRKIRNYLLLQISEEVNKIENYLDELTNIESINDYEKEILRDNLISLRIFEILPDYKYTLIAMGSILEFLLIRHCERNRIEPEDYRDPSGSQILAKQKKFVNYVQSAIKTNLFKRKNSWHIIQHNLRNFRNYVHIKQETKDERIDKEWYRTIKPHFERILNDFISQD